jgi:ferric-dicitrate binding protein FerR (iron transport regulator)
VSLARRPDCVRPATRKNYRNEAAIVLNPSAPDRRADRRGRSGSGLDLALGAINTLVTTLLKVTVTNPAAVIGDDERRDLQLRDSCYAKLGSLSPFGPWV